MTGRAVTRRENTFSEARLTSAEKIKANMYQTLNQSVARRVITLGSPQHLRLGQVLSMPLSHQQAQTATTAAAAPAPQQAIKSWKEIPGPTDWPVLGAIPYFVQNVATKKLEAKTAHEFFMKQSDIFGPIWKMKIPGDPPIVLVSRPEDCEIMTRATMDNPQRPPMLSIESVRKNAVDNYFEGAASVFISNGEEWQRVRSHFQTPMMKPSNITPFITAMDQVTLEFTDRMAALQEEHGELPSNFQNELYKWGLESVGLVALNRRLGCLDPVPNSDALSSITLVNRIFSLVDYLDMKNRMWRFLPFRIKKLKELQQVYDEFVRLTDRNIQDTEASLMSKAKDTERELTLLEMFLLKPGVSRKEVVTMILDMFFAGIDTTSHTVAFAMYLLARNPEVQARLQEEIDSVLVDNRRGELTAHHLAQLSYLKAVVRETFRFFPLGLGFARTLDRDIVLCGYHVPKGTNVLAMNLSMGWDESLFPRAGEFLPERWLRHKPLGPIHPYASLPFGAGTRMCIGRRIAEQEMYIFLTRVMQRFNVDYKYENINIEQRLVFMPSKPLRFNLTERY
ncbi:hypothetical protein Pcinc_027854 [Petrolisthes cinctipes]|uniref:Cytochrome P450 n=1 Tax=Petrolisthes cinctipes TaxID=88211 RepID=A0AAE1F349_PETCI|nr:hypothetical protein Pcinc_027854 [Petrolisthes cinctipes]